MDNNRSYIVRAYPKEETNLSILEAVYPEIMTKIQFQLAPKPSKQEKTAQGKSGFVPVKAHWAVEQF